MSAGTLALLLIILGPFTVAAAIDLWRLWWEDWLVDERRTRPTIRLSLVLAVTGTIGALGQTLLFVASVAYFLGVRELLTRLTPAAVSLGLLEGGLITIINAGYLRWLRRHFGWRR